MGIIGTLVDTVKDSAVGAVGRWLGRKVSDHVTRSLEEADWDAKMKILRERIEEERKREGAFKAPNNRIKVTRMDGK